MAGKHHVVNSSGAPEDVISDSYLVPPAFPGGLLDRAYAEGRQNAENGLSPANNPHPFGSEMWQTWANGHNAYVNAAYDLAGAQLQTNIPPA